MSKDNDKHQRQWKSLGYGGKSDPDTVWRWWEKSRAEKVWIISAPNGLAEFEQRGRTVFLDGEELFTGRTQWDATWRALAYFYEKVIPTAPAPPMS